MLPLRKTTKWMEMGKVDKAAFLYKGLRPFVSFGCSCTNPLQSFTLQMTNFHPYPAESPGVGANGSAFSLYILYIPQIVANTVVFSSYATLWAALTCFVAKRAKHEPSRCTMSSCSPVLSPSESNHTVPSLKMQCLEMWVKRPLDTGTLNLLRDYARRSR